MQAPVSDSLFTRSWALVSAQAQRLLLDFPSLLFVVAEEGAVAVAKDLLGGLGLYHVSSFIVMIITTTTTTVIFHSCHCYL